MWEDRRKTWKSLGGLLCQPTTSSFSQSPSLVRSERTGSGIRYSLNKDRQTWGLVCSKFSTWYNVNGNKTDLSQNQIAEDFISKYEGTLNYLPPRENQDLEKLSDLLNCLGSHNKVVIVDLTLGKFSLQTLLLS